jgi:polysaccharide biosynthesis protein PslH
LARREDAPAGIGGDCASVRRRGSSEVFEFPNKMKILYIVPFVPWEVKVRSFNLIPRLARKHEIFLVCVSAAEPSGRQEEWLSRYCEKVVHVQHSAAKAVVNCVTALPTRTPLRIAYCRSSAARQAVRRLFEEARPDVVYVERWRALQFVSEGIETPIVCDPTDSMTLYNRRMMKANGSWQRVLGWEEWWKFSQYEGKLARRASICVFCSRVDLECVRKQAPEMRYELVGNGVDGEKMYFKHSREEEPATIVFTGSFKYRPNRQAARYFLEKILPCVRKQVPEAKFVAVGNGATKALREYRGRPGVEAVDFVPDLRPFLAKATVAVAPLTVGAGVSNKLAEGFAVGTALVATPLACGDLPVKNEEHLLIGRDASEFAEQLARLLGDQRLRRVLAANARRLVDQHYDWEIVARKMEHVLESVATKPRHEGEAALVASSSSNTARIHT